MNIIVCLDDNNGMMFNKRRQSQDKLLRVSIKELVKGKTLFMNEYSYKLYKDINNENIIVSENYLDECENDNFCLVENKPLNNYIEKIDNIIIYKWNRIYPSDLYFDVDIKNEQWELIETEEFQGSSHEKITKETYRRIK
ncbi:MAG: ribonuclease Z [Clostridium sp.]|nr:ribonuclease Z [Clostridium sp.]